METKVIKYDWVFEPGILKGKSRITRGEKNLSTCIFYFGSECYASNTIKISGYKCGTIIKMLGKQVTSPYISKGTDTKHTPYTMYSHSEPLSVTCWTS